MPVRNRLTEVLQIESPILLAPMDGVAGGRLAAAVSAAGGLGLLGGGYGDPDWIEREVALAGGARIGCGFITWSVAKRRHALAAALKRKPVAIMLSFGDPAPFVADIRAAGAKLICQVQSVVAARQAVSAGADVVVAQGMEAGGHGMSTPLLSLLPQVVDVCGEVPVVAAGGIADGRGLAAALALGAQGVLMGTRFYASLEADAPAEAKRRIVAAGDGDSVRSIVFDIARGRRWPEGYTGRCLRNAFAEQWLGREGELAALGPAAVREYAAASDRDDFDVAAVIAGEACGLIHDIPPAADLVARILREAERVWRPSPLTVV